MICQILECIELQGKRETVRNGLCCNFVRSTGREIVTCCPQAMSFFPMSLFIAMSEGFAAALNLQPPAGTEITSNGWPTLCFMAAILFPNRGAIAQR